MFLESSLDLPKSTFPCEIAKQILNLAISSCFSLRSLTCLTDSSTGSLTFSEKRPSHYALPTNPTYIYTYIHPSIHPDSYIFHKSFLFQWYTVFEIVIINFQLNLAVWFVLVRMEYSNVRFTSVKRRFVCIDPFHKWLPI